MPPLSTYYIITRGQQSTKSFVYQQLPELSPPPPFGKSRFPPFQYIRRLKDFPPSLRDAIVVASSASTDISLVTRSKTPLSSDVAPDKATDVFAATIMADDSRRAQLPMTLDGHGDTYPIGVAFDLSSKIKVKRPLPKEEHDESPGPLPALMVLNNEGILSTFWFVYAESIRQATTYPGLTIAGGMSDNQQQAQRQASPFGTAAPSSGSTFGGSPFGKSSTPSGLFGAPGANTATSTFGSSSAFGAPSGLGQKPSPWANNTMNSSTSNPAFGQSSLGSAGAPGTTGQGAAFGATTGLGNRSSPWGSAGTTPGNAFGQPSKLITQASPFSTPNAAGIFGSNMTSGSAVPTSGGFASFAGSKGFTATATPSAGANKGIFGQPSGGTFDLNTEGTSIFGQPQKADDRKGAFGGSGFTLGSTFKGDDSAVNDAPKSTGDTVPSLFGDKFGSSLGEPAASQPKDAEMDEGDVPPSQQQNSGIEEPKNSKSSAPKPASPKFQFPNPDSKNSASLFGTSAPDSKLAPDHTESKSAGFKFGSAASPVREQTGTTEPEDKKKHPVKTSPQIKEEPESDDDADISPLNEEESKPPEGYGSHDSDENSSKESSPETPARSGTGSPEPPLPPESTSKTAYAAGDSSSSSKASDDAPLPPDFLPTKSKLQEVEAAQPVKSELPESSADEQESFEGGEVDEDPSGKLDDEGSGVDVAQEISPASSKESSKITPGSTFDYATGKGSPENLFSAAKQQPSRQRVPLFGELGEPSIPLFPAPKAQESPRSPSPVRSGNTLDILRPGSSRSISAPGPSKSPEQPPQRPTRLATSSKPQPSAKDIRNTERERILAERERRFQEEHQSLSDEEDEQSRKFLATEIEASRTLDEFVAHQDYVGKGEKHGIPGQIEIMFRDINSMIDTLGLNSRSLMAFTKAHESRTDSDSGDGKDLEQLDDWCLVNIEDLDSKEEDMLTQVQKHKLQGAPDKLADVRSIGDATLKISHQSSELGETIRRNQNGISSEAAARKELNWDQKAQLKDLRKAFTQFQKQLADAEAGVILLRTKLASQLNGRSANGRVPSKQPTVEAVENTIRKMTNLISQKSDDIDLLSSQLANSGLLEDADLGSSTRSSPSRFGDSHSASRSKRARDSLRQSGNYSRNSISLYKGSPLRGVPITNGDANNTSSYLSKDQIDEYRNRSRNRQEVNEIVKSVFGEAEVIVRKLD